MVELNNSGNNNNNNKTLNPHFITGYSFIFFSISTKKNLGESSFSIRIRKTGNKTYSISPVFSIPAQVNYPNKELLEKIQQFFEYKGWISRSGNMYSYEVTGLNSLKVIRNHFEKFPLETSKIIHFKLWCEIISLLEKKAHLTYTGLNTIFSIKANFPKGVSKIILENQPEMIPRNKPEFTPKTSILNPNWIAGFVQADGTFGLNYRTKKGGLGYTCEPKFRVTQHERDLVVLKRIIASLGCGILINPSSGRDRYDISVGNMHEIRKIIIPFFNHHPLYGAKFLDFISFCNGVYIMENKGHLTEKGLHELKLLTYSMNTYRNFMDS